MFFSKLPVLDVVVRTQEERSTEDSMKAGAILTVHQDFRFSQIF